MSVQQIRETGSGGQKKFEYLRNGTGATISKKTPGYLDYDTNGAAYLALFDDATVHHLCVAAEDVPNGEVGLFQVGGRTEMTVPSGNYTAGNGFGVTNGAIVDSSAVFPAAGLAGDAQTVAGVITTGGTAVTEITVELHGKAFTSQT